MGRVVLAKELSLKVGQGLKAFKNCLDLLEAYYIPV